VVVLGEDPLGSTSQDIVVDVEPTSQHGADHDIATVTTSALVDGRRVLLTERHDIVPENGQFRLSLNIPVRGTALTGRWSVHVLLPRDTELYEVQVVSISSDGADGQELRADAVDARRVIAFYGQHSLIDTVWQYIRPRG
jgi:hypothetical protein